MGEEIEIILEKRTSFGENKNQEGWYRTLKISFELESSVKALHSPEALRIFRINNNERS
jgi:hypothetical protein